MTNNSVLSEQTVEGQILISITLSGKLVSNSDYYKCTFRNCHFDDAELKNSTFDTCRFEHCNFNNARLTDSIFKDCHFTDSTFVGVDFTKVRVGLSLEIIFENCNLSYAVFSSMKLSKSKFVSSKLEEADFADAKLDESVFTFSDLTRTIFNHTNLHKADFRGAKNYTIDPRNNFLKGAVFSEPEVMSLLDSLEIRIGEPPESVTEI